MPGGTRGLSAIEMLRMRANGMAGGPAIEKREEPSAAAAPASNNMAGAGIGVGLNQQRAAPPAAQARPTVIPMSRINFANANNAPAAANRPV